MRGCFVFTGIAVIRGGGRFFHGNCSVESGAFGKDPWKQKGPKNSLWRVRPRGLTSQPKSFDSSARPFLVEPRAAVARKRDSTSNSAVLIIANSSKSLLTLISRCMASCRIQECLSSGSRIVRGSWAEYGLVGLFRRQDLGFRKMKSPPFTSHVLFVMMSFAAPATASSMRWLSPSSDRLGLHR